VRNSVLCGIFLSAFENSLTPALALQLSSSTPSTVTNLAH